MRFNACFIVALLACSALQPAIADDGISADKSAVEAAFLYNFALLTEWPSLPADEFRICVSGSTPVLAALESVKKKQIKGHQVSIIEISTATQALSCQVLFIGSANHASIATLSRQIGNAPVLVVSDANGYNPNHVIITLIEQRGRVAFNINLTAARQNSLNLSSRLLKLAQQVY